LPKVAQLNWKWSLRPIYLESGLFARPPRRRRQRHKPLAVSIPPLRPCSTQMRSVSASRFAIALLFQIILSSAVVSALSFTFSSDPTQCSSLTVTVNGGTAPYRLNLIPAGPMPRLSTEIRTIVDVQFSEKTYTLTALKFPADSQFIAMVSDATGGSFFRNCSVKPCVKALTSTQSRCWNWWNKRDSYRLRLEKHLVSPDNDLNSRLLLLPEP
jgi:hypothetical protein